MIQLAHDARLAQEGITRPRHVRLWAILLHGHQDARVAVLGKVHEPKLAVAQNFLRSLGLARQVLVFVDRVHGPRCQLRLR